MQLRKAILRKNTKNGFLIAVISYFSYHAGVSAGLGVIAKQ